MRYFSMFSGIGGFENGIGESHECVGYSEIDKYATAIYTLHYPNHINYGDANEINPTTIPDFGLLVGGFPCQAFSIAGKRQGFNDTRGTLFFDIAWVLTEKRPRYFVLENVKGLLSHGEGKTFQTILGVLADIGYGVQWQVLNSKDFGVPQNRERVFIIGYLGNGCRPEVFPIGESDSGIDGTQGKGESGGERVRSNYPQTANTVRSRCYKDGSENLIQMISRPHGFYKGGKKELPCLRGSNQQNNDFVKITHTNKSGTMTDHDEVMALRAGASHNYQTVNRIRRLTPVECERLQGFPDNWTEYGIDPHDNLIEISNTQRYKCIGNAVTTTVVRAIMEKLL